MVLTRGQAIYRVSRPVTSVHMCISGGGSQCAVLIQVETIVCDGRKPLLHRYATVAPSLVCTLSPREPFIGLKGAPQLTAIV